MISSKQSLVFNAEAQRTLRIAEKRISPLRIPAISGSPRFFLMVLLCIIFPLSTPSAFSQSTVHRIALLSEEGFPSVDGFDLSTNEIRQALKGYQVRLISAEAELDIKNTDLLITPYGSAFPKAFANSLLSYLRAGGRWINLGGTPLAVPVIHKGTAWESEVRQAAFHKILGITQSFRVTGSGLRVYNANSEIDGARELLREFQADDVYEQYVRFTSTKDFPEEDGTAGQRDAILRPLLWGTDSSGVKRTAPFVAIDQLQGEFAGGRWVFANFKGTLSRRGMRWLANYALQGPGKLTVSPDLVSLHDGEIPSCAIQINLPGRTIGQNLSGPCVLVLFDPDGNEIQQTTARLTGTAPIATGRVSFSPHDRKPGLYTIRAKQRLHPSGGPPYSLNTTTGFWMYDTALIKGRKLSAEGAYLLRDGKPYPVTGTTYMASDVARKFLLEPNPAVWDADFALMKQHGINMVRTGLWTGWKTIMLDVGSFDEAALRALEAFVLTAHKYDIPVIFSFFAFIPETWGGENAYLDPRSVNAQRQFLAGIAQRFATCDDIIWDLINEPSFCNPKALWSCRPNYDRFETAAWKDWLLARAPLESYRQKWRMTTEEALTLPRFDEFADLNIFDERRPLKVIDYRLFAQDMFRRWIGEMTEALRSNGNPRQLITVGQDEGGTNDSPNNQFMGDALGFTSMHNWWLNDDLVWDNIITKKPGVPNLLEETGVMFYEKMDGSAWRSEEETAALLERKLAIALGAGGAGFVEWIWNINPFMKSDNEATIGLFRHDGTAKPELQPVTKYARFFSANRERMTDRQPEEVVMVIPHSNMFSTRNSATEATKRAVRVLSYRLGVPVAAVSEYGTRTLGRTPKLIILPSPGTLAEFAWRDILGMAKNGSTLLLSGPIDADEYRLPVRRLQELGIESGVKPVAQEETLIMEGKRYPLSYRNLKFQRLEKGVTGPEQAVVIRSVGRGSIMWSPLPVENADNIEATVAWYTYGIHRADVHPPVRVEPREPGILVLPTIFQEHLLVACVSETDRTVTTALMFRESQTSITVTIPAQRTLLLFVDRKTGAVVSQTEN